MTRQGCRVETADQMTTVERFPGSKDGYVVAGAVSELVDTLLDDKGYTRRTDWAETVPGVWTAWAEDVTA